jgi:hypothetical protein
MYVKLSDLNIIYGTAEVYYFQSQMLNIQETINASDVSAKSRNKKNKNVLFSLVCVDIRFLFNVM